MEYYTIPLKTCTKCKRVKPLTSNFWHSSNKTKDGFRSRCKRCRAEDRKEYYHENRDNILEMQRAAYDLEYYHQYYLDNKEKKNQQSREWHDANKEKANELSRQWYHDHKEYSQEKNREYYHDHKEEIKKRSNRWYYTNHEQARHRQHRYYLLNRNKHNEYARKWAETHPDKRKSIRLRWDRNNPHKKRIQQSRRRARKRSLLDTFTLEEWEYCLEHFNYTCPVCDSQLRDLFGNVEPHADHWIPLSHEDCPGTVKENMVCLCSDCNWSKGSKLPDIWLTEKYGKHKAQEILKRITNYFESLE